jgi:hypothetical protein
MGLWGGRLSRRAGSSRPGCPGAVQVERPTGRISMSCQARWRACIKMIKRQMYGRAKFDLLRRRILAPI